MQLHGSILPKMIVPLLLLACWASLITALQEQLGVQLGISSVLLTVTGFVVGLGLSFRTSTAYERYAEGRRYWGQLTLTAQSLGRVFWIHTNERPGQEKDDLLGKL
jgi:ion channel-forming bestrophin family protein